MTSEVPSFFMDSREEFYDSLDEDSNYGSVDNDSIKGEEPVACPNDDVEREHDDMPQPDQDHSNSEDNASHFEAIDTKDGATIPFYDKELNRSEIELSRVTSKSNSVSERKSKKQIGRGKINIPLIENQSFASKSYLHIFQTKLNNEFVKKKVSVDAASVTCQNSSPKSFVTCQDFEENSVIHQNEDCSETESSFDGSPRKMRDKRYCSSTLTSLDSKFHSVSEQCFNNMCSDTTKTKKKNFAFLGKVPLLGGLGAEVPKDKLNSLKKRQQYGLQVSQKNRIKMIEKKLLQNLRREMKECSKVNI